jgi:hypothetical protein
MNRFAVLTVLVLSMTGCQGIGSDFVSGAEEAIRLKWAEEWKPALKAELTSSMSSAQDALLVKVTSDLEHQEEVLTNRLASVNIRIEDFDKNKDGNVTGAETTEFVAALKSAKDEDGNSLGWYEMLMAVVLGYGGTTGAKEWMKSKMGGTGNGTQTA